MTGGLAARPLALHVGRRLQDCALVTRRVGGGGNEGQDAFRRAMESMPSPAAVADALARPEASPYRFGEWTVASTAKTSRHGLAVLVRRLDDEDLYCQQVFDRVGTRWDSRGGGGVFRGTTLKRRPQAGDRPLAWLGTLTFSARESRARLRVTGGRASSEVARVVVHADTLRFEVGVDDHGWFHVFLEGEESATITAQDDTGRVVRDLDGLPITLRLE